MAKRAPGGGRKPLAPTEPTVKVAVTLLASQADELKQFGNGNLSAGIRRMVEMNIRKPDNTHVDFKSLDWQNAVATMTPRQAVALLAKEVEALVNDSCADETPQYKSRQAELAHNAFVAKAYPHLAGTQHSLFYRDVALDMYDFRPLHEPDDA